MPKSGARFALVLAAAALALWLGYRDELLGPVLVLWRIEVAKAVLGLIQGAGMEATREASAIYHPGGFAIEISRGCTGFVPAALLATAICAYPAAGPAKVAGVFIGVPLLLGLNLARLAHLFYVGVHQPQWFHTAHTVVWEAVIVLAVLGLWCCWATWAASAKDPNVLRRPAGSLTVGPTSCVGLAHGCLPEQGNRTRTEEPCKDPSQDA